MDLRFIKVIENHGCVDEHGHRLYGTSALLHILRLLNRPISNIQTRDVEIGRAFVQKHLNS